MQLIRCIAQMPCFSTALTRCASWLFPLLRYSLLIKAASMATARNDSSDLSAAYQNSQVLGKEPHKRAWPVLYISAVPLTACQFCLLPAVASRPLMHVLAHLLAHSSCTAVCSTERAKHLRCLRVCGEGGAARQGGGMRRHNPRKARHNKQHRVQIHRFSRSIGHDIGDTGHASRGSE